MLGTNVLVMQATVKYFKVSNQAVRKESVACLISKKEASEYCKLEILKVFDKSIQHAD